MSIKSPTPIVVPGAGTPKAIPKSDRFNEPLAENPTRACGSISGIPAYPPLNAPVRTTGRVTPWRSNVPAISIDLAPVIRTFSDRKTIFGNLAVSSIFGPFTMSRQTAGAASISSDEASMVVTTLEAGMLLGSNVSSASKRLNRVV